MTRALPLSWHEARRRAHDAAGHLPAERVRLEDAAGRVLADDLVAPIPVPHYASSAMDGWAVAGEGPWRLTSAAADPGSALRAGEATPIVTGGVIPPGARGVLRSEHGVVNGSMLERNADAAAGEPYDGQHVRPAGTEATAGETLFSSGTRLSPAHVAVAAGCGHDDLAVVRRPQVALVLTGEEVVEQGVPGAGEVRDSFGPALPAVFAALGADVVSRQRVGDEFAATLARFVAPTPSDGSNPADGSTAAEGGDPAESSDPSDGSSTAEGSKPAEGSNTADIIVTTGGTGDSRADHVRPALRAAGADFLVDGIAVRPGAPALLARLPDGRLVIGLPGNPLAALLALLTFAHPLVSAMQGSGMPPLGRVRIAVDLPAGRAPTTLRPYRLVAGEAQPTAWHGAGMLRGLAEADGVLVVPREGAAAGAELEVLPLPW